MPICVSYLTNTMPIIGGGGGGVASLIFANANGKYWSHSGNIYADILIFANANFA